MRRFSNKALRKREQRIWRKCRRMEAKRREQYKDRVEDGIYRIAR